MEIVNLTLPFPKAYRDAPLAVSLRIKHEFRKVEPYGLWTEVALVINVLFTRHRPVS